MKINYKLLTPGPLTTSAAVKEEMLVDHCTWDDDYKQITRDIRAELLRVAGVGDDYTAVLTQGSGTFGIEALLSTVVSDDDKLLICTNGAYGLRMTKIARCHGLNVVTYDEEYENPISAKVVDERLSADPSITIVVTVHCETTTGLLNDLASIGAVVQKHDVRLMVDAMSSFGGIEIDLRGSHVDYLVSSANKCIQGVPGFSFALIRRDLLEQCEGRARTVTLDLYDQWKVMEQDGKWRFTSPTHVVLAFAQALRELDAEGGVAGRQARYTASQHLLVRRLGELGFKPYIDQKLQAPIITTFLYPEDVGGFTFKKLYDYLKAGGFVIYPGKLTKVDTFRIGNIGEIYEADIEKLCDIFARFVQEHQA